MYWCSGRCIRLLSAGWCGGRLGDGGEWGLGVVSKQLCLRESPHASKSLWVVAWGCPRLPPESCVFSYLVTALMRSSFAYQLCIWHLTGRERRIPWMTQLWVRRRAACVRGCRELHCVHLHWEDVHRPDCGHKTPTLPGLGPEEPREGGPGVSGIPQQILNSQLKARHVMWLPKMQSKSPLPVKFLFGCAF